MADEKAPDEKTLEELRDEVRRELLVRLLRGVKNPNADASKVKNVAEAYAWVTAPEQAH